MHHDLPRNVHGGTFTLGQNSCSPPPISHYTFCTSRPNRIAMSATDTPDKKVLAPFTSRELAAVDGVLKDMSADEKEANVSITVSRDLDVPVPVGSPGPPATFGAGGPMYAAYLVLISTS